MPIEFPHINLMALLPETILIIFALLVMLVDLFIGRKRGLGHLSLLGLALAGGA
jgi:NADH:ubiquinone oxidoreductase subunit 2 (subunit N)